MKHEEKRLIEQIKQLSIILQSSLCAYGTKEGDGHMCDCKYSSDGKTLKGFPHEESGCAEARKIIWNCEKILKEEK